MYSDDSRPSTPGFIVPPPQIVGAATWEIESAVRAAQRDHPDPGSGPPNRLIVPQAVQSLVLQWSHSSKISFHPGARRTLLFSDNISGGRDKRKMCMSLWQPV